MKLTPQQESFLTTVSGTNSVALRARAGSGKCLGLGTPILMADGTIKAVETIVPGDLLAGPTSPKVVLSISTGRDFLYQVTPTKGDPFVCNKEHILTLAGSNHEIGRTIDIPLSQVISQPPVFFKNWKLFRAPIYYWNTEVPVDPYFYGLWLGDGHCKSCKITTADHEIRNYLSRFAQSIGYYTEEQNTHASTGGNNPNCWDIHLLPIESKRGKGHKINSPLWDFLKSSQSGGYKNILLSYLTSSRTERLKLLAGLLDSDGSLDKGVFEIATKDQFLCADILHLARSCGFAAFKADKIVKGTVYKRVIISGDCDEIPTRISRKQAPARRQPKRVSVTGFTIQELGEGDYYGFTLAGDGRFLLGDFTVTHNTSSLRQWAAGSRKTGIATSFSKSTVKELADKIGSRFPAKTFHAMGFAALKGTGRAIRLDNSKMYNIVKSLAEEHSIPFELQGEIRALAIMAKTYGIQPDPAGPEGLPAIWEDLATQYDIEFSEDILYWAKAAVMLSNQAFLKDGLVDFDDMLYCALIFPHRFSRVPVILADEVQDFNALQHTMLRRCLAPGGRIIAAGDDRQAIYAFRGALANSYSDLVDTFSMSELPLTVSFRCPQEVVRVAQQYVPDIEAAPGAPMGSVLYPSSLDLLEVPKTVLCPHNAPLMRLALQLLIKGRTVEIAGRDIGQNLIKLTQRITKKNLSTPEFLSRLAAWKDREIIKYPRRVKSIHDKVTVLRALSSAHDDLASMQKHLFKLYPDVNDKSYRPADVHLSTIHKAKGREWPRVLFLDSHLFDRNYQQEWEMQQAQNCLYVGVTRAQEELIFIRSEGIEGIEPESDA